MSPAKKKTQPKNFNSLFLKNLKNLSKDDAHLFDRIYKVQETVGNLVPPTEMISWIESTFGSVDAVKKQEFVKITDLITYEGAVFNELRMKRPVVLDDKFDHVFEQIQAAKDGPFSHPLTNTPEDTFGRIKGKYSITCSNVTKYDGLHGIVIFNNHNPLLFSRKRVRDYFRVAKKWYVKAHQSNSNAIYPMYTWNCLWKAAASVIHGHSQLQITEGMAYSKIEELRHLTLEYLENYHSNYFDDVYRLHSKLNLALERDDIRLLVKITPIKEKEIMILSDDFNDNLADVISDTLTTLKEELGVMSFNLSIILPPIKPTLESWNHMPIIVRIVDRGKLSAQTVDIGAMELYAQSIIETNPYTVIDKLKPSLLNS